MIFPHQELNKKQQEAALPGASVWVSANAGTGKTTVLINRILRLLLEETLPERILAITFTRAAAAEMENRLFEKLGEWAGKQDGPLAEDLEKLTGEAPSGEMLAAARKLLVRTLECPGGMRIQTIHSFCQSLLARFPLEAGLAPHFRLLDETEARALRTEARTEALRKAAEDDGPLGKALVTAAQFSSEIDIHETLEILTSDATRLLEAVRKAGNIEMYVEKIAATLKHKLGENRDSVLKEARQNGQSRREDLARVAEELLLGSNKDQERGEKINSWLDLTGNDSDAIEKAWSRWQKAFCTIKGEILETLATKKVQQKCPDATDILKNEAAIVKNFSRRLKRIEVFETTNAFVRLGVEETGHYERLKRSRVAVDYNDLIEEAGRLLTRRKASEWILYKLDGGVDHILVDEAQDTSPGQWRVIEAMAREFFVGQGSRDEIVRTIFAVGDSKQSIFRFQGADPSSFKRMRKRFEEKALNAQLDWRLVSLDLSFRSTPTVLEAVDRVYNHSKFGPVEEGQKIRHDAHRKSAPGCVEIWPPVESPEGDDGLPNTAVEELANQMAERIKEMTTASQNSGPSEISPGDIMILVRKRLPYMPYIARALRRRNVAVAGLDRMDLVDQPATIDLINLGRFLLLPQDDLVLANVLKGPLAGLERGITEEGLFELAHGRENSLWSELRRRRGEKEEYDRSAKRLEQLLKRAEVLPPFELFSEALDGPGGARSTLLARLGADAVEAVEEFLVQAMGYERREVPSLEGFLAWLEREKIEIKRDMEAAGENIRIMTVHAAKGLEAPVVFVVERALAPSFRTKVVWDKENTAIRVLSASDRDEISDGLVKDEEKLAMEEYWRLLYVAMTRARDHLIVASWQGKRKNAGAHWPDMIRDPMSQISGIGADDQFPGARKNLPRLVLESSGTEQAKPVEVRESEVPEPPPWARQDAPREQPRTQPIAPSGSQGLVHNPLAAARGTFAHLLLEHLADLAPGERKKRAKALSDQAGRHLPGEMRAEVAQKVLAILDEPALSKVFGPGSRSEVGVAGRIGDDDIQGAIDRLVVNKEEVLAVEFKSGEAPPSWDDVNEAHRRQIESYIALLKQAYPDKIVRGTLLYWEAPSILEAESASKARPT